MSELKKQINLEWLLLCGNALLDKESNNLTLVNIVEGVKIEGTRTLEAGDFKHKEGEVVPISFVLVARFRKLLKPEQDIYFDTRVEVLDPKQKKLGEFLGKVEMMEGIKNFRSRMFVNGLKVTDSGQYTFRLQAKHKNDTKYLTLGSTPLDIELLFNTQTN